MYRRNIISGRIKRDRSVTLWTKSRLGFNSNREISCLDFILIRKEIFLALEIFLDPLTSWYFYKYCIFNINMMKS